MSSVADMQNRYHVNGLTHKTSGHTYALAGVFSPACKHCRDIFRAMLAAIGLEDRGLYDPDTVRYPDLDLPEIKDV